jgi:hypothetical protein
MAGKSKQRCGVCWLFDGAFIIMSWRTSLRCSRTGEGVSADIGMRLEGQSGCQLQAPAAASEESDVMKGKAAPAKKTPEDKVTALRSVLRAAPKKRAKRSRSPLKAAVALLLPDLLAFRAKGYSGVELAEIMREHGFILTARTLTRYIAELRPERTRKRKAAPLEDEAKAKAVKFQPQEPKEESATPARSSFFVAKPLAPLRAPLAPIRKSAKEVLGHRFDDDV